VVAEIRSKRRIPWKVYTQSLHKYAEKMKTVKIIGAAIATPVALTVAAASLLLPAIGVGISAATITSTLASVGALVGYGMTGGVILISATAATGAIGTAVTSGSVAYVIVGNMAAKIMLNENIDLATMRIEHKFKKEIESYMAFEWDDNGWSAYVPSDYKNEQKYTDHVFVEVDKELYYCTGEFVKRDLLYLTDFQKITFEEEAKQQPQ